MCVHLIGGCICVCAFDKWVYICVCIRQVDVCTCVHLIGGCIHVCTFGRWMCVYMYI